MVRVRGGAVLERGWVGLISRPGGGVADATARRRRVVPGGVAWFGAGDDISGCAGRRLLFSSAADVQSAAGATGT
ncbi:hypothetical protein ACIP98_11645 [Streptomyces sp. NPDC088354]|uniref:hypothetical protein n=1 Tax=Streptomyces sp. NPDC088354 TaxID=3365856 RepID=UPI00382944CF